jgi:hypothetical protein
VTPGANNATLIRALDHLGALISRHMSEPERRHERISVGEALKGLMIYPLEDAWTALDCLVLIKCLDEEGNSTWAFRATRGLNREELLGALTVHREFLLQELLEEWEEDFDDEE